MFKPLRWYEVRLLSWLARSPRIDLLWICQFPGDEEQRKRLAARLRQEWQADALEQIYKRYP